MNSKDKIYSNALDGNVNSSLVLGSEAPNTLGSLFSMLAAVAISFSLFILMAVLIKTEDIPAPKPVVKIDSNFVMPKRTILVEENNELPVIEMPPEVMVVEIETDLLSDSTSAIQIISAVDKSVDQIISQHVLPQLKPAFKALPIYPSIALRRGLEGYVDVAFNLSEVGVPVDIQIIRAEPEKVFDRSALKAVAKWRYDPNDRNAQEQIVERITYLISD